MRVGGKLCPLLFYADDIVLMASTAEQLTQQLSALEQFCEENGMQVNVQKTKVLVTGEGQQSRFSESWLYAGQQLEQVVVFKYLGIEVHAVGGLKGSHIAVTAAATKAMWCMMRQVREMEVISVLTRMRLFKSLVMPVMQYGCEIWCTEFLKVPGRPLDNPVQRLQTTLLRQVGGVSIRNSVPVKLLMAEFGCRPVSWQWCKLVCRYWDRLVSQSTYPYLQDAFRADLEMACNPGAGHVRCSAWCSDVLCMLSWCDPEYVDELRSVVSRREWNQLEPLDIEHIMEQWQQAWWVWPDTVGDPRVTGGVEQVYASWMSGDVSQAANYVVNDCFVQSGHLRNLVQFRVGAHKLQVVVGRWAKLSRQSGGRSCRWCAPSVGNAREGPNLRNGWIEDEKHVLLECPRYCNIRRRFSQLLDECEGDMQKLMCHRNQAGVAHFVHAVMRVHAEPVTRDEESISDTPSVSGDDDESELIEVSSGELLSSGDSCDDNESELVELSSGELLLSTLLAEVDD